MKGDAGDLSRQAVSREGYEQAIALLHDCCSPNGFLATPSRVDNYRRVWGRDSSIMGIAALLTRDRELVACCRRGLLGLAERQGPHGEIPSNFDPDSGRISYGGTAGRVDADLWWILCCGAYWRHTQDGEFLDRIQEPLDRTAHLLGAWEFNNRGLLFVPPTGDWADEYVESGYVLYDNLLYLQVQRELTVIHAERGRPRQSDAFRERSERLERLLRTNYWLRDQEDPAADDVYHEVLYNKGRKTARCRDAEYWLPFFSPIGYGFRFDAMANVLASLTGVASEARSETVDAYIDRGIVDHDVMLLPAFHPVITPKDEEWEDLQMTFSYTFKNEPYEFHNGGLWPLVTGFYAADLANRGREALARSFVRGIHAANRLSFDGDGWGFPEFLNGRTHEPGGTQRMGWSAAAALFAEHTLSGDRILAAPPGF